MKKAGVEKTSRIIDDQEERRKFTSFTPSHQRNHRSCIRRQSNIPRTSLLSPPKATDHLPLTDVNMPSNYLQLKCITFLVSPAAGFNFCNVAEVERSELEGSFGGRWRYTDTACVSCQATVCLEVVSGRGARVGKHLPPVRQEYKGLSPGQ